MDYTEKKKSMNLDLVQLEDNFQHKNFKGKISCVYLGLKWVCRKCLSSYKLYIKSVYTCSVNFFNKIRFRSHKEIVKVKCDSELEGKTYLLNYFH